LLLFHTAEEKVANKKEKKTITFTDVKIWIFCGIGMIIGLVIAVYYFNMLFIKYVQTQRTYMEDDWVKVQYYANRVVDQAVKLKKMMVADKVKYDPSIIDNAVDTRAQMIGTNMVEEKIKLLAKLEPEINKVIEYYDSRLDLKNKRFGYIEWGMITTQYLDEYGEHRERFVEAVLAYNDLIARTLFKMAAKQAKLGVIPGVTENTFPEVNTNREKYYKKDGIYRMDLNEGSSSASSY
jgi:hypothetical protein